MRVSNPRTLPHGVAATLGFSPRGVDSSGESDLPLLVPYRPLARLAFCVVLLSVCTLRAHRSTFHNTPEPYPISGGSQNTPPSCSSSLSATAATQALRSHNRSGAPARRRPHHHRARKPEEPPRVDRRSH